MKTAKDLLIRLILATALAVLCLAPLGCSVTVGTTSGSSNSGAAAQATDQQGDPYAYVFRSRSKLKDHYYKHGREMGFSSPEEYEMAASAAATNPKALHKLEKEDNDDVYYVEATNEFVIVSTDGYIRTYFCPDDGKAYFNRQ